ncbi:MAG TPA: transglutaminase-like domain-containing protein [Acidimicrobiia bacterium]|nr:transglutaminase-like domain-containing protein [Acidimicrobiia bacterium]
MDDGDAPGDDEAMARFAELVALDEADIPLDEAAFLIAAQARPGLDVGAECGRLDDLAAGCPETTFDGLARYLFRDLGFRGNAEHYRDPDNSYLDQVLRRRLGIPITLSVVTIEVGRRLGVPVDGVGMPGHFIVRHRTDPVSYLDPFGAGRRLDEAGCRQIFNALGGTGWNEAYLAPVGPRAILSRMLLNLQGLFLPSSLRSAAWVLRLRLSIPGLAVPERLGLARALGSLGRSDLAAVELDRVADGLPDEDAVTVRAESRLLRARFN